MTTGNRTAKTHYATVAACAVLLLAGVGFRSLDAALSAPGGEGLSAPDFRTFPMMLGDWSGRDVPMSNEVVRAADVDAHLNRAYVSRTLGGEISLFIGYGVRVRDLVPHRPSVRYPGAGWRLDEERAIQLPLSDATTLPCSIFRFSRGGVDGREITVLNYYLINGSVYPDVNYLRMNAWQRSRIQYVAQVQIACTDLARDVAERRVSQFGSAAAAEIQRLMPVATRDENP